MIFPRIASNFLDQKIETEWVHEDEGEVRSIKIKELLIHYGLKTFCIATAWSWMRSLGMRYCDRKKNFYVDGHERKDVVMSRWKFMGKYLSREIRMHRWTQITEEEPELLNKCNAF